MAADDGNAATPGRPAAGVRLGLALFVLGLGFLAGTVLPFFLGAHDRPLWLNLGCLLAPVGLAVAVTGAILTGRADQRAAAAAQAGAEAAQAGAAQAGAAPAEAGRADQVRPGPATGEPTDARRQAAPER